MTRVLICTPTHSLQGGVERIMESLALHLPARGFDVVFALAKGARFDDPDAFRAAFPMIHGVDVDGTSGTTYGRRRSLRRVVLATDPDIVLMARMFDIYPVASALKLEGHRLRLAVTVQAFEPHHLADLRRYQEFVDVCIASGEQILGEVQRTTSVPTVSIPGGVAPPGRLRKSHVDPLRIGYVGRIEQLQKRVLDLPLLAAELERRDVPFTLDVAGDGSMADELHARLPRARFHGWLSTAELYDRVYPELDVLVHFADYEGVTIAPREAMVHGVVPVVSRFVGAEDFFDGVNALAFPIGDVGAAANAIEHLHRDRALLERLSVSARDSQSGIRSEQGAIAGWAAAFREAVAQPSRIGPLLPPVSRDSGFLTRLGVPDAVAEVVRRVRRRKHEDPGSEWPHWSGME
ncbi:MAG TPA: glycosyltransferase family 4 protein [Thermoanaerobaculia bacterium]|jgi:glycosyltransferase involved in cell wall biosynthesis|nr:glycosyltransferase family 4 protein [Thermoanaerobaculia bacterium]